MKIEYGYERERSEETGHDSSASVDEDIRNCSSGSGCLSSTAEATVEDYEPMEMDTNVRNEETGHDSSASVDEDSMPSWRRRKQPIHQKSIEYWSLKDMWSNYHEIDNPIQILWPALQATAIVLAAVLIVGGMTYAFYRTSGSSMSVNRPWTGGVMEHTDEMGMLYGHSKGGVVLGEHQGFETESP